MIWILYGFVIIYILLTLFLLKQYLNTVRKERLKQWDKHCEISAMRENRKN
jgi:hypothetical protein